MNEQIIKIYKYRWVVLAVFALLNILIAIQWLTFAPIAREARAVYGVSALKIDLLSMIFMGIYVVICIPASYIIDTHGIKIGIGIGAVLTGVFSLMKGFCAESYIAVVVAQVGLAVAQPFILNAATKVAARWFPVNERASAVGISILAQFAGIVLVMMATPGLVSMNNDGSYNLRGMLMTYGIISAAGSLLAILLLRERPGTPPCKEKDEDRFMFFEGLKHLFKQRDMRLCLVLFFIGLGMFNAVSTCIDQICELKGLDMQKSGTIGGVMLIAGIAGALVLPPISDKLRKRKIFLVVAMAFMTPGLAGLTFGTGYHILLASSAVFGFFLLGAGAPIGFQYIAEVSHPAPESTSQGITMLAGQISGMIFIVGMNTVGMINFMYFYLVLAAINVFLSLLLKESKIINTM